MNKELTECFIITYDVKGQIFIRMQRETRRGPAVVHGFKTEREALDFYEKSYGEAFRRGQTWAAGAIIMDMQLQPRIHFATLDQIRSLVGDKPNLHTLNGEAVFGELGLICLKNDEVHAFRERGKAPKFGGSE